MACLVSLKRWPSEWKGDFQKITAESQLNVRSRCFVLSANMSSVPTMCQCKLAVASLLKKPSLREKLVCKT